MPTIKKSLATVALAATIAAPMPAFAASPEFCRDYAEAAVRQAHEARETRFCERGLRFDPARWSEDRRGHFEWCVSAPREAAMSEREARTQYIRECRRHE